MKIIVRFIAVIAMLSIILQGNRPVVSAPIATSIPANTLGVAVGAYLRPTENWGDNAAQYKQAVGGNGLSILNYYLGWLDGDSSSEHVLNTQLYDKIRAATQPNYPVIMITWQPLNAQRASGCARDYSVIPLSDLAAGVCDPYIRQFARDLSVRPERFLIRFANEMNVQASQWWPGHFGQGPEAYVAAYRHVYDVFTQAQRAAGRVNAEWVWAPNYFSYPAVTWNLLHNYYPGDQYVDWVGLSGYNWFPAIDDPYRTFSEIFGEVDGSNVYYSSFLPGVLRDLACNYAKPQIIAEYGTVTEAGNIQKKQAWIADAFSRIPNYPFLRAVAWYNDVLDGRNIDFRVTNTPLGSVDGNITKSYATAISPTTFQKPLPSLKAATPPMTYCATSNQISPVFNLNKPSLLVARGQSSTITLTGMFFSAHPTVRVAAPSGANITGQVVVDGLNPPWGKDQIRITAGANTPTGSYTVYISVDGKNYPVTVKVVDRIYPVSIPYVSR